MKAVKLFLAVSFLTTVIVWQLAHRGPERGAPGAPSEHLASSAQDPNDSTERRTPVRHESSATAAVPTGRPASASVGTMDPFEQRSLEERIRAAQRWFAYAGNSSNGAPRLVASVRAQKFDFIAEDDGVSVRPWSTSTNWSWRMGSAGASNVAPKAEKGRATYTRGAGVTEWFENGALGVEQGFTLDTADGDTTRRMPLRVATELRPKLRPEADGVDFVDANGDAQLHYDSLHAYDADGKTLRSWMEVVKSEVRNPKSENSPSATAATYQISLAVDTSGAKYPITIDPVISLATERIRHPGPVAGDLFGVTVAVYGNMIALGAPKHQVGAVPDAGVVYLFIRDNNCDEEWTLLQKVESPNPYNNGQFGRALSIGNGALAVAAHRLATSGGGGDVLEDVVHVFQPSPTNSSLWTWRATLKDPDQNAGVDPTNYFGCSISVNAQGTHVAVGSPRAWSEGGQFPFRTGEVFFYGRDTGGPENWGVIHTYQPPFFVPNARFGRSVAMDGDRIAVGAPGYFSQPPNTNGSVFVIETSPGAQGPARDELPAPVLPGSQALRGFGERVALSGNQLAVAAADSTTLVVYERRVTYPAGVASVQWSHGLLNSSTLPFVIPGSKFAQVISLSQGTLLASYQTLEYGGEDVENDLPIFVRVDSLVRFEHQGDAGGDPAVNWTREASAPVETFNLRGLANAVVAGNLTVLTSTNDNLGGTNFNFGLAVAMRRQGGTWAATQRFVAGLPLASNDLAGTSIAVSDDLLVVGAPGYDVGGVADSGAVHVFRRLSGLQTDAATTTPTHGWMLAATLFNDTPQTNGRLGESVAVKDGLVVAGAPGRDSAGGTVWIWKRASEAADVWTGEVVLGAPSGAPGWKFGSAVSFNGTTLAVGSPFAGAGRAHLFQRGTTNDWPVLQTLLPRAIDGRFGAALDLDEADNLIVGSPDANVNGPQSGEAYIYRRTETPSGPEWVEEADPGSFVNGGHTGASVAIDRGWAFVGSPGEVIDSGRSGIVRVYARNNIPGNLWEPVTTLEAPASLAGVAHFGTAIALDEHTAVIGAPGGTNPGSAFVYSRVHGGAGAWRYTAKLLDPCNEAGDGFGSSIALDHDRIFVGSPQVDILSAGHAGTVTLFERQGAKWTLQREVPDDSNHRIGSAVAVSGDWMVIGSSGDWDTFTEGPADGGQVYVLRRHDGANGAWNVVQHVVNPAGFGVDTERFGQAVDISDRVFVVGSEIGTHTFELTADGQVTSLGRLVENVIGETLGRAVAIHGQRIAVAAFNTVSFFVRTNEYTARFGEIFVQTHWLREARQSVGYAAAVDLSDTTAVVGSPGDVSVSEPAFGTVSVFERDQGGAGRWGRVAYFTDPDVFGDELFLPAFGTSVALDGDTLVVGTWYPDQQGSGESGSGSIFQRHAGGFNHWGKVAEVGGPVVAVSGDWVASGYNWPPPEADETGDGSFRYVALHHRNAGGPDQWGEAQRFFAPNTSRAHTWNFGAAVALDGSTLVIGAPGERRTAIDSTPGRAFIYDVPLNSLQIWKDTLFAGQYFTAPVTPFSGQAAGNLGDPDNDGVPNAWEAYHGTSPLLADAALAGLSPQGLNPATSEFVVRWREAIDPQGLSVKLQWSRDLGQWFGSGAGPTVGDTKVFTITTVESHADHVIKEGRLPAGSDTKIFTRLVLVGP